MPVAGAWYVGDTAKDLELGLKMGCKSILVRTGKGRQTEPELDPVTRKAVSIVDNLAAAADRILASANSMEGGRTC